MQDSEATGKVLIVHPDEQRASEIGQFIARSDLSWEHHEHLRDTDPALGSNPWVMVIVGESIFASQNQDVSIGDLRAFFSESVVLVGLIGSHAVEVAQLFGVGVDLILYEPLVFADIERALAFSSAVQQESHRQARERLRRMAALHELAVVSGHRTGAPEWMDRLIESGRQILGVDALAMWSVDWNVGVLHCVGSSGLSHEYIASAEEQSPVLMGAYEQTPKELSTRWITTNEAGHQFGIVASEAARSAGIERIAWIPIRDSRRRYGHLSVYFMDADINETYDLVLADAFASIVASALGTFWLQTEIRRNNRLYREHVESSPDGIVVCLLDGTVERLNEAIEQIAGRDRYDIIGESVFEWFLQPEDLPWERWKQLSPDTATEAVDLWLARGNSERRRVSCYARRLQFTDPYTLAETEDRIQLVVRDVTVPARRLVELELLHDLTRLVTTRGSLAEAYELVVNRLYEYLNYRLVSIAELKEPGYMELQAHRTHITSGTIPERMTPDEGLCGLAVRENRSIFLRNVHDSPDYLVIDDQVVSEVIAVIRSHGETVGYINIETDVTQPLGDSDLQLAESIAGHLGLLIEQISIHEQLERQALTDPLTGIANRRAFMRHLHALVSDPESPPAALLLVELDHFKSVNDRFGHLFGDEMLKQVSGRLQRRLGENDVLARYGGDEIAMIFHDLSTHAAFDIAEELREEVATEPFSYAGSITNLTVSIGVACFPYHGRTPDELIGEADRAMYAAKIQGRNSVEGHVPHVD